MKKNRIKMYFLCLCLSSIISTLDAQTSFQVKEKSGTTTSFQISDVQKLTFPNQNLLVTNIDGSNSSFTLTNLNSIIFNYSSDITSDITSEITSEITNNAEISIYLNPVSDELHVSLTAPQSERYSLQIIDINGRVINRCIYNAAEGNNNIVIPIENLQSGVYLLTLCSIKNSFVAKFIKK